MLRIGLWAAVGVLTATLAGCQGIFAPRERLLQAPWQLDSEEQAALDRVLQAREAKNVDLKAFASRFTRWEYDPIFGPSNAPRFVDEGEIEYVAPDKMVFRILKTHKDGQTVPIEPERAEHWVRDGKSLYYHDHETEKLTELQLPPSWQEKVCNWGPFLLLFETKAERLKELFFIRIVTPPGAEGEIWLEAYPRFEEEACNFKRAELILKTKDMMPSAMQYYAPNGKNRTAYAFDEKSTSVSKKRAAGLAPAHGVRRVVFRRRCAGVNPAARPRRRPLRGS
ncbi:MAG: hypothetical protein HQ567_09620 [Candidatus Nealsonbacteria bacterium]|nr:hypothetical protein [Candidatus Nealsonbacteria bacterium]